MSTKTIDVSAKLYSLESTVRSWSGHFTYCLYEHPPTYTLAYEEVRYGYPPTLFFFHQLKVYWVPES